MTASAQAALDAMAAAESVARNVIAVERLPFKSWARDRVRLIERDRDTLELHAPNDYGDGQPNPPARSAADVHSPCLDLQAVIRYWCHDEETP
jgi:hypothetical protein